MKSQFRLFFEKGSVLNDRLANGGTALHLLILCNSEFLVRKLAKLIDPNSADNDGLTPLHVACAYGMVGIINILVKRKADINKSDKMGRSPLHMAADGGHCKAVKTLLQHENIFVNRGDANGVTPLYVAALKDNKLIAKDLLHAGANPLVAAGDGFTPEQVAKSAGYMEIWNLMVLFNGVNAVMASAPKPKRSP